MHTKKMIRLGAKRLFLLFLVATGITWLFSEAAFIYQKDDYDRAPEVIELVIPEGTAERIANGMNVPSIPEDMVFVTGDTLVVKNLDLVQHQLGPLYVPAGKSAALALNQPDNYAYTCSFQPSKYMGLDVRQPTTIRTRLTALVLAAPALTVFLFVYSIILVPLEPKAKPDPRTALRSNGHGAAR